jgi:TolB protein
MSPAWSRDGQRIAYVRVAGDRHELRVWDKEGAVRGMTLSGNTIISPAYHPDGRLAVSADPEGNPDIYFLEGDGLGQAVVRNWAIDISPGFDSSGRWMSFVSSRLGNPHIFLKDLQKDRVERISYEGDYNTSPAISPSGQYVAYSRLTEEGHRIFIHDRLRDTTRQLTHGPGDDEDPTWGPDGYFLAFASNRSGRYRLYIGSRHGGGVKEVATGPGAVKGPDWSPELR